MTLKSILIAIFVAALLVLPFSLRGMFREKIEVPAERTEVVFWHFWGGEDRDVVDDVVARFNEFQDEYFVRAIAMPGNNLQAKLFLSVAGGDPPDIVNQDDPVLADWGERGVIHCLDEFVPSDELNSVRNWLLDSAERLSVFDDRLYGVCNGLDIRALYYNKTSLDKHHLAPPSSIADLDRIALKLAPPESTGPRESFGYLPDSRRLWAWGYVFGGDFYDFESKKVLVDQPEVIEALNWMASFSNRYGEDNIIAFRKGDQSLPGKTFPLLPILDDEVVGRYSVIMDGQWRVRNIEAFQKYRKENGLPVPEFGVCPLPSPPKGRQNAGWVNGNFFVFPKGSKNARGAWEFAKFWIGYSDADHAAMTCAAGGWIPVAEDVMNAAPFQNYLRQNPLFGKFVELAASENQFPVPQVVGASMFRRTVESAAYDAITQPDRDVTAILEAANDEIQNHLDRVGSQFQGDSDE